MRGHHFLEEPFPGTEDEPIISAEELAASMELRATKNRGELSDAWGLHCDHFEGEARIRLQETYADVLRSFGALHG